MMKNNRPSRENQALKSQSHQKNKMNKSLKTMIIFSKDPSTMKAVLGKKMMTRRNFILLTRTLRMS
jgi:hypothetical protein